MNRNALRDYQRRALKVAWKSLMLGGKAQVALPTGTGKTRVFVKLAERWYRKRRERVLVIAPRRMLVVQAADEFRRITRLPCDLEMGEHHSNGAPVVCATVHSMSARLGGFKRDAFGLIVFDESDFAAADSYREISKHFKRAKVFGCTATPHRHDRAAPIAPVVVEHDIREMIERGHLVRVLQTAVKVSDASRVKMRNGDFDSRWLDEIFSREKHLHEVVKPMLRLAGDRPTIVFGVSVLHAKLLANLFNRLRPGCAKAVWGKSADQDETMEYFRRGYFQFLCNCNLITRGVDIPAVSCIGMARPTLSRTVYLQMIGRGTRLSQGKRDLLVVDFTTNSDVHPLTALDAITGDPLVRVHGGERERGDTIDVVSFINEVEGELEADPELRKRIQAKIEFELRSLETPEQKKVRALAWVKENGRPLIRGHELYNSVQGYKGKSSNVYDPDFAAEYRALLPNIVEQRKVRALAWVKENGRPLPVGHELFHSVKGYRSKSSEVYDPDFAAEYRALLKKVKRCNRT